MRRIFQFQKGSINTEGLEVGWCEPLPFQFQKGSINTQVKIIFFCSVNKNFNSKKVRLIRDIDAEEQAREM